MAALPFPDRSHIRAHQLRSLQSLLRTIVPANAFYATKLSGVAPELTTFEDFAKLPFTTKADLVADQAAHLPFGSNLTFPLERYTRYHQTSGTTGSPLRWLDTNESWAWMRGIWLEILRIADVTATDRIVFAFSFGPFLGFWLAFEAGTQLGALCLPAGGLSSSARLRMILDTHATVLCCTPTYAIRLATAAAEEQLNLSNCHVRHILVAGEPGGSIPATRATLSNLWPGARVFDHPGMTETGPVSFECPVRPGFLHIMESAFYSEILDPASGAPVVPGQPGELVLTNLGRTGSPLLRYRTGDLVKEDWATATAEGRCACGRADRALEGGILGRVDDMIIVRGVNVYPTAVEDVVRSCQDVAEYQVTVSRNGPLTELRLKIEPRAESAPPERLTREMAARLQQAFNLRIPVEIVPPGSLPRYEMKARRWIFE